MIFGTCTKYSEFILHDVGLELEAKYEAKHEDEGNGSSAYVDAWNASYVKMPCSPQNLYYENVGFVFIVEFIYHGSRYLHKRVSDEGQIYSALGSHREGPLGSDKFSRRIFCKNMSILMTLVFLLKRAVLSYNARFVDSWNFNHLAAALQIKPEYGELLSKIAKLALKLPHLIKQVRITVSLFP